MRELLTETADYRLESWSHFPLMEVVEQKQSDHFPTYYDPY